MLAGFYQRLLVLVDLDHTSLNRVSGNSTKILPLSSAVILLRCIVAHWNEILVCHSFLRCKPFLSNVSIIHNTSQPTYLMIISEQLVEEIYSLRAHKSLVVCIDETLPTFLRKSAKNVVVLLIQFDVIFVKVLEQIISAEHFCDLHELI